MNKGLVKSTYTAWLLSDKQLLTAVAFICLYLYTISPIKECATFFNEPINLLEPIIAIIGNGYSIPIVTIAFLITIIDFPDISGNVGFVLIRTGRGKWYFNQLLFLIAAILTYIIALFIFSVIFTAGISFLINGWSNTVTNLELAVNQDLKNKHLLATIDLSILNNFRPYTALAYSVLLTVFQLILHGQLQIYLGIRFNRIVGILASVGILGIGLALWVASSNLKWIFPFAHLTIGWHYGKIFNETTLPLWVSFVYLIAANVILYILGQRNIKNKQFYLEANIDDQD